MISSIDFTSFFELLPRFFLNSLTLFFLIRLLYYPITRRKDYLFTYILIGTVIFLLCYLLANVQLQLGFALGLFAVFGIIKYRTDAIPIKEMTYLFIVIGISVINSLFNDQSKMIELLFTNFAVVFLVFLLERVWFLKNESSKIVMYEKIELIKPENRELLLADLKSRTGINITKLEIGRIDFLRDTALIKIYYLDNGESSGFSAGEDKWKNAEEF